MKHQNLHRRLSTKRMMFVTLAVNRQRKSFIFHSNSPSCHCDSRVPKERSLCTLPLMTTTRVNWIRGHNGQSETKRRINRGLSSSSQSHRVLNPRRKWDYSQWSPLTSRHTSDRRICLATRQSRSIRPNHFQISFLSTII